VLQRCIDHAAGAQKVKLIQKITVHATELVVDPFGNYVVQYIRQFPSICPLKFKYLIAQASSGPGRSDVIRALDPKVSWTRL
jgi:hypothetical protein